MRKSAAGAMIVASVLLVAAKKDEASADPGPRPTDAQYRSLAEQATLAGFFDPGSAQFDWPFGIIGGYFKPVLQGKKVGWWTCGQVNGKNRMGGYVGFRPVVVVVRDGTVVFSAVSQGGNYDFLAAQCQQAIRQGILPRAEAQVTAAQMLAPDAPQFGIATTVVPDGIYIAQVAPNSVASAAGLTAGMVITRLNGIPVKGMELSAVNAMLRAAEGETTFDIVGRPPVRLTKAPLATPQ